MDGERTVRIAMRLRCTQHARPTVAPPAVCEAWKTRPASDVAVAGGLTAPASMVLKDASSQSPFNEDVTCDAAQELASIELDYIHCTVSSNMRVTANPGLGPASSMQHMPLPGNLGRDRYSDSVRADRQRHQVSIDITHRSILFGHGNASRPTPIAGS